MLAELSADRLAGFAQAERLLLEQAGALAGGVQ